MNSQNTANLNKSSLISLQAELARKKEEVRFLQQEADKRPSKLSFKNEAAQQSIQKPAKVKKEPEPETSQEDSVAFELSRNALIAKSQLYDKLRSKEITSDKDDQYLVNFERDADGVSYIRNEVEDDDHYSEDENSDPESDWVDYVDSFGRTRTCLRRDLPELKKTDAELVTSREEEKEPAAAAVREERREPEDLFLWHKKSEELRKKWEEEELALAKKRDIHYQNVLFDEARTHGVGYYNFSQDENERLRQQEALKEMREEAEKNQAIARNLKEKREQQMKQRLAAARRRKCERLGLSPDAVLETDLQDDIEFNMEVKKPTDEKTEVTQKVEEYLSNIKRSQHVRPWDVGKAGVKTPVLTQEQWVEKQRAKREQEFAPPSAYSGAESSTSTSVPEDSETAGLLYFTTKKPKKRKPTPEELPKEEKRVPIRFQFFANAKGEDKQKEQPTAQRKGTEIPPPLSYDKSATSSKTAKPKSNISDAIEAGLNFLRQKAETKAGKKDHPYFDPF